MKIFLSYSTSPYDASAPARLRAVAAAYGIQVLLPERNGNSLVNADTRSKIMQSDAVVALVTNSASQNNYVNEELKMANILGKPVVALAEGINLISGFPENQIVLFDRYNPTYHESNLINVLNNIQLKKKGEQNFNIALLTLVGMGLGLLTLAAISENKK